MVEIHHIFFDSYKLYYCWKSVKKGNFLLFGPLLGNKESYWDLPYGLLAELKINNLIKTYFRVSVYPLGSGSVGTETETREKI